MTVSPTAPERTRATQLGLALFVVALLAHLACSLRGWWNLPVDGHEFRQTQTALSIRHLIQDGLQVDYETPLLGKPWAVPLEFPLYQFAAAVISKTSGLPGVQAGRLVGIIAFYLMLPALYGLLAQMRIARPNRLPLLALVLSSPIYLFYTRAILIESTALCLGVWFLWGFWSFVTEGRRLGGAVAFLAGALCAMVKITTLGGFLAAAALLLARHAWSARAPDAPDRRRWSHLIAAAGLVVAVVIPGFAWAAHADTVKALNPMAELLSSSAQSRWGMGPPSLRFSSALWAVVLQISATNLLGGFGLFALVAGLLPAPAGRRWPIGAALLCYISGPAVLANMYRIHDYYFYASGLFLLGATAIAINRLASSSGWRKALGWGCLVTTICAGFATYSRLYYPLVRENRLYDNPLSNAIRATTRKGDVVIIYGQEWNPLTAYLAERRALMFPGNTADNPDLEDKAFANLDGETVSALVVTGPRRLNPAFVRRITSRFDLAPEAVLTGKDSCLYVAAANRDSSAKKLRSMSLPRFAVPELPATPGTTQENPAKVVAELPAAEQVLFECMTPRPITIRSQFGIGPMLDGDQRLFSAHPSMAIVFEVPPGARRLHAEFGIAKKAYEDSANSTDGVEFAVLLRHADQSTVRIARRMLRPADRTEDRGGQSFDLELPEQAGIGIILTTEPGPAGNLSFDWAYWRSVTIQ